MLNRSSQALSFQFLKEAYPFGNDVVSILIKGALFGAFVFLFLLFYQPFGLVTFENQNKVLVLLGYGLITTFVLWATRLILFVLASKIYNDDEWTVLHQMLLSGIVLFFVGLANLLYSYYLGFVDLDWQGFLSFQLITLAVGSIPIALTSLWRKSQYRETSSAAIRIDANTSSSFSTSNKITLNSLGKGAGLVLNIDELQFIRSLDNYLEVHHVTNGNKEKALLRNTQKRILNDLKNFPQVVKSHRSYLVNLQQVQSFEGNAQGLKLHLLRTPEVVPVSRKYVSRIKELLSTRHELVIRH